MPESQEEFDSISHTSSKEDLPFEDEIEKLSDLGIGVEKEEVSTKEVLPSEEPLEENVEEEVLVEEEASLVEEKIFEVKEEPEGESFETIITEEPFEEVEEEKTQPPPVPPKPQKPKKEKVIPFLKRGLKIIFLGIVITGILLLSYPAYLFLYDSFYKPHKYFKSGLSYIQSGEFEKAENKFKEGLNSILGRIAKYYVYNRFGEAYLKINEYKKAEEKFNEAGQISPNDPVYKNNLVKLYIKKGDFKKSEKMCKEILKIHPKNIPAYINLSRVLLMTSRPNGAIKCLKYVLSINKNDIEALSLYQHALVKVDKYRDALSVHRYLYHITKGKYLYYPNDLTEIGYIYLRKGNLLTSADVLNTVLKHYPKHARARFLLSQILFKENKTNEAIKELEKTIKYNPHYDDAYTLLGKIYYDKKMYDKALLKFHKAAIINPKNGDAFEGMGDVYYNLNTYNEAVDSYTKALEQGKKSHQIKYNLAVSLYKTGKFKESLKLWEDLLATKEDPTLEFNLANTHLQLHNLDYAKNKYENLINFYTEKIKVGASTKEEKKFYQELSLIYNNLGVIRELQGGGRNALSSYFQAVEFASLGDSENKSAYNNINRTFNLKKLESINQGLNDVKKVYKIEEKPKEIKKLHIPHKVEHTSHGH